ncbi:MAG: response regulator [Exilispira sp.]
MKLLYFGEKTELALNTGKFLASDGFQFFITEGKVSLEDIVKNYIPDVIIVDSSIIIISAYEIIKKIKQDPLLKHCPVFLLTTESELNDLDIHLDLGIDEVILKPFDLRYLSNRIKLFYRMFIAKDNNPLTGLPGNRAISLKLQNLIIHQNDTKFAVIYSDLDNFKPYNDFYGFAKGDEIILYTAKLLDEALKKFSNSDLDFLGHIGGDDFILITIPENIENICNYVTKKFDQDAPSFYNENDRKTGYIVAKDRENNIKQFKFLSISLAVVTNMKRRFDSLTDLSKVAAEIKKVAKSREGSSWYVDKRENDPKKDIEFLQKYNINDRRAGQYSNKNKGSILVVDDQRSILEYFKNILEYEGFEVDAEFSASKALFKISFKKYDLIITDISMPEMDGLSFIKELRTRKYGSKVPVVVVSAFTKREIILDALKLGVRKFFKKPIDNQEFLSAINFIISNTRA